MNFWALSRVDNTQHFCTKIIIEPSYPPCTWLQQQQQPSFYPTHQFHSPFKWQQCRLYMLPLACHLSHSIVHQRPHSLQRHAIKLFLASSTWQPKAVMKAAMMPRLLAVRSCWEEQPPFPMRYLIWSNPSSGPASWVYLQVRMYYFYSYIVLFFLCFCRCWDWYLISVENYFFCIITVFQKFFFEYIFSSLCNLCGICVLSLSKD